MDTSQRTKNAFPAIQQGTTREKKQTGVKHYWDKTKLITETLLTTLLRLENDSQRLGHWYAAETHRGSWLGAHICSNLTTIPGHGNDDDVGLVSRLKQMLTYIV